MAGRTALLVAVILTAVTVGCSSGGDAEAVDLGRGSPLATHLGLLDLSDPDSRAGEVERLEAAQAEVVACMAEAGFTYTPTEIDLPEPALTGEPGTEGTDEWVATWGFGISTRWFPQDQVEPDLLGYPPEEAPSIPVDPNADYVAGLDPAEQERYQTALFGGNDDGPADSQDGEADRAEDPAQDPADAGPVRPSEGCQGDGAASAINPFYQDFATELQELNASIAADPAFDEFNAEVAACMADRGVADYVDLATAQSRLEDRLFEFEDSIEAIPPAELTIDDLSELSEEELAEFLTASPTIEFDEASRATLGDLQADEVALAVAVGQCGGGVLAEEQLRREVRARYEEAFIADNEERLEAYRR